MLSDQEIRVEIGVDAPAHLKKVIFPPVQLNYPFTFIFRESDLANLKQIQQLLSSIAEIPESKLPSLRHQAAVIEACTLGRHDQQMLSIGVFESKCIFSQAEYLLSPSDTLGANSLKARNKFFARHEFLEKERDQLTLKDILVLHERIHQGIFELGKAGRRRDLDNKSPDIKIPYNPCPGELRLENVGIKDIYDRTTLLCPIYKLVPTFLEHALKWINEEQSPTLHPIVKAIIGSYMFYAIQPHIAGNTAVKRILYEDMLIKGGCDLRGVVSLAEPITHDSMAEIYASTCAGTDGRVNLSDYIKAMGEKLAEALSLTLKRAEQVQVPQLRPGGVLLLAK